MKQSYLFRKAIAFLGIAMAVLLLYSCNTDEVVPKKKNDPTFLVNSKDQDKLGDEFARALASSLKSEEVRSFVKQEVLEQFDGDYDMLFTMTKDKSVTNTVVNGRVKPMTFADVLSEELVEPNQRSKSGGLDSLLLEIQKKYPTLQVSVPELPTISAEDWNIEEHQPLH